MARILVIDDNESVLELISTILISSNYDVVTAANGEEGIKALGENYFDIVITDLMMPNIGGMEVLDHVITKSPKTICIILTGHGTIQSSVEAIKKGAFDYITKPVSANKILLTVEKALKFKSLEEENTRLKKELRGKYTKLIGTSVPIRKII